MVRITIDPKPKRSREDEEPESVKKSRSEPVDIDAVELNDSPADSDDQEVEIIETAKPPTQSHFRKAQCPVCLEVPDVLVATECGHMYCYDCVFAALCSTSRANKKKGECSVCRASVRYDKVHYLQMRKRPVSEAVRATPAN